MKKLKISSKKGKLTVKIDSRFFPENFLEILYKTAYVFIDKAYIGLDGNPKGTVRLTLAAKDGAAQKDLKNIAGEFYNELVHQWLRTVISKENQKVREYIVGRAVFGVTQQIGQDDCGCDEQDDEFDKLLEKELKKIETDEGSPKNKKSGNDPLGILKPWEEKHASKRKQNV